MARIFDIVPAVRLGNECIEAEKQSGAEDHDAVEEALAQTSGADSHSAVRKPPDQDRVHNAHAHPANFGKHQRECKAQSRPELFANSAKRRGLVNNRHGIKERSTLLFLTEK